MRTRLEFTTDDLCMIIMAWELIFTKGVSTTNAIRHFLEAVRRCMPIDRLQERSNAITCSIPKMSYSCNAEHIFLLDGEISFSIKRRLETLYDWHVCIAGFHSQMGDEDPLHTAYCVLRSEGFCEMKIWNAKHTDTPEDILEPESEYELVLT